jgi:Transposase DDE domain
VRSWINRRSNWASAEKMWKTSSPEAVVVSMTPPLSERKQGGLSKIDLAIELLSHTRNRLKCKPQFVLFDSWYPAKRLLKRLKDYGWYFVCQLKKHRTLDGVALHAYRQHPYGHAVGHLSGGLKVLVVRHRRKYYVTNRLTLPAQEVRAQYRKRQDVERERLDYGVTWRKFKQSLIFQGTKVALPALKRVREAV